MRVDVACFTGQSGITDYSVSLCRALAAKASVRLLTATSLPHRFRSMGFAVETPFRRSRHYPIDFPRLVVRTARAAPDWLLLQSQLKSPIAEGLACRYLRRRGVRTALAIHDVLPHYPRPWSRAEYSWYYRQFDALVVHSQSACDAVRAMNVHTPVAVIPHGVYDLFRLRMPPPAQARQRLGLSPQDRVVLFFGHLEPRKGLGPLLDAARALVARTDIKFVVAGSNDLAAHGPQWQARLDQARRLPNVLIHDRRIPFEEVEDYFCAADVVALPYLEGTTSGVLKLAIAFGKPVVASTVGDLPHEVPPGGGELLPVDRLAEDLPGALTRLLEEPAHAAAAMQAASRQGDWSLIADRYLDLLQAHS